MLVHNTSLCTAPRADSSHYLQPRRDLCMLLELLRDTPSIVPDLLMICEFRFSGVHWSGPEDKKMGVRNAYLPFSIIRWSVMKMIETVEVHRRVRPPDGATLHILATSSLSYAHSWNQKSPFPQSNCHDKSEHQTPFLIYIKRILT